MLWHGRRDFQGLAAMDCSVMGGQAGTWGLQRSRKGSDLADKESESSVTKPGSG